MEGEQDGLLCGVTHGWWWQQRRLANALF